MDPIHPIVRCVRRTLPAAIRAKLALPTLVFALVALASCDKDPVGPERVRSGIESPSTTVLAANAVATPMVAAGWYHTCALKNDGTVVCWGYNGDGQVNVPVGLTGVTSIAAGYFNSCALKGDGTAVCWGQDYLGSVSGLVGQTGIVQLAVGYLHTCALKTNGVVACWGYNQYGQTDPPVGLTGVTQIIAAGYSSCALKSDGTVVCWGYQGYGAIPAGLSGVTQINGNSYNTCALKSNGTVVCWGYGYTNGAESVPVGLTGVVQAAAGFLHTCVRKSDGAVVCWGDNYYGQSSVPAGVTDVLQISTGYYHGCAIKNDGTVVCWGYQGYGPVPAGLNLFTSQPQTIAFTSTPPSVASVGTTYTATATGGGSGNPVVFSSLTSSVCAASETTPAGTTFSLSTIGTCTIAADQAAGPGYQAAPRVTQTFSIVDGQTILFTSTPPAPAVVGATYLLSATGGASGNAVTFSSLTSSVCTVDGTTATLSAAGTCTIAADQGAGAGYLAAPQATQSFTVVAPQRQEINFTSSPVVPAIVNQPYEVTATGGGSGNPVLFSSLTPSRCFVIGNTVSLIAIGTCTVAADQTGNTLYLAAAQATQTFDIYDVQRITFSSSPPSPGVVGESYLAAATGGLSGNGIIFTSLSVGVCYVSGNVALLTGPGTCTVAADQSAGGGYLQASQVTQRFTVVEPIPQMVNFTSPAPNPGLVNGSYLVSAAGGASGNPVQFSSTTPSVCLVFGHTVSLIRTGTCNLAADQNGNTLYLPATRAFQTFDVYDVQTVTIRSTPPEPAVVGGAYILSALGGLSGNPVIFSSLTNGVCTVAGNTALLSSAGVCTIAADQAGGGGYLEALQATQSFTVVAPQPQAINFLSSPPSPAIFGGSYLLSASGGGSGQAVTFTSATPSVCATSGSTVSFNAAGTCTVAADQAGSPLYFPAQQATQTFMVNPAAQFVTFTSTTPNGATIGGSYLVSASGGASGNAVTFSSLRPGVCTLSGATVSFNAPGTCSIAANQSGNTNYLPAPQVTQTFDINGRPVANPGSAQSGNEGSAITFNAGASSDPDGDALIAYTWSFGDGGVQSVSTATVQHVYNDNKPGGGAYVVTLQVTDAKGATSPVASTSALISNIAPTATFVAPSPVGEGTMNLALTGAHDALGDLSTLEYAFDCGDGTGYKPFAGTSAFACAGSAQGLRNVRGKVKDKDGAVSEYSRSVSVVNVAPLITIISAPPNGNVAVDYTLQFKFSDPGTSDAPWFYQITWGDGKKATGPNAATAQGLTITQNYRYAAAGTYTITVRVTDKDGGTTTKTAQVTVVR